MAKMTKNMRLMDVAYNEDACEALYEEAIKAKNIAPVHNTRVDGKRAKVSNHITKESRTLAAALAKCD